MSSLCSPLSVHASPISSFASPRPANNCYRIAVLGPPAVGKTAIINQFLTKTFLRGYWSTVQERYIKEVDVDGETVVLDIFDTPGSMCFSNVRKLAIENADAFILVYSVADESSFEKISAIRNVITKLKPVEVPVIVVGNKTDSESPRFVSEEDASSTIIESWGYGYVETTAKDNAVVSDIFHCIVSQVHCIVKARQRQSLRSPTEVISNIRRLLGMDNHNHNHSSCSIL